MKICHILNKVVDSGNGIISALVDLACEQAMQGHQVTVLSSGGEYTTLLNRYGVNHYQLIQTRTPICISKAIVKAYRLLKQLEPDIVHAHMMTGVVIARIVKPFLGFRLISTIHNEWQKSAILMGLADRVIAVSQEVGKAMTQKGIPASKIRVVTNGTFGSVRYSKVYPERNLLLKRPAITTVAGLFQRKGISCLIRAFELLKQQIPEAQLYIVGEGPDRTLFEAQRSRSPVASDIHFEGFQANPAAYLEQTDIFVLASLNEPFGLAISEARNAGCAVVGSHVGGIPEVLEYGKRGQLFPPNDHHALADILVNTLADQSSLAEWRNLASGNLEWLSTQRMCNETLAVYQQQ